MTFWKPEYANIGGFGDPTSRYPLGEEHMTGFQSKQAAAQAKLNDDDDIQDYKKPWVGLTDDELMECTVFKHFDYDPPYIDKDGAKFVASHEVSLRATYENINDKLKQKNT